MCLNIRFGLAMNISYILYITVMNSLNVCQHYCLAEYVGYQSYSIVIIVTSWSVPFLQIVIVCDLCGDEETLFSFLLTSISSLLWNDLGFYYGRASPYAATLDFSTWIEMWIDAGKTYEQNSHYINYAHKQILFFSKIVNDMIK